MMMDQQIYYQQDIYNHWITIHLKACIVSMYKRHGLTVDCDLYPRCYSPNQTRLLPKFRKCFSESMMKDYISFMKSNYVRCELNKCECRSGIVSKKWR